MRIVLMGMPGVGKGTQALRLKAETGAVHLSTGDILREAVQAGSDLGRRAKDYMESGALVPDELMGELIGARLDSRTRTSFILDGFPRTLEQVRILDAVLARAEIELDGVYLLSAPEEEIVRRLSGRRVCPHCGAVFHLESHPPQAAGVCDACGAALAQRPDDAEEVIRERLRVYREQTLPLAAEYRGRGLLHEVDGTGGPDEVFSRLQRELGER